MVSNIVFGKRFAVFVALPVLLLQGCLATQDWVREQLTPTESRVGKLEGQLEQMTSRMAATENRLTSAEGRISQVDAKVDEVNIKAEKALTTSLICVWSGSSYSISKMGPFMPQTPPC